jgi:hypothetical protein
MRTLGRVTTLALVLWSAPAYADSLDDQLGPREIAVGEAMRGGATGASAISLNPAGLPLNKELVFEGGYGYRASDAGSLINISACDSTNALPGCFFYDYAGSSPELGGAGMTGSRRTHVAGFAASRMLLPRVLVGANAKYHDHDTDMPGETSSSGFSFDLGATLRLTKEIGFGISGQNLFGEHDPVHFPRAMGGGFQVRPMPTLTLGFDMRWRLDGAQTSARYGGGAELFLRSGQNAYPIRAGVLHDNSTDATYASAGLGIANMKYAVDIGARRQLKGGDETLILASMRFYGPREPAPSIE